MNILIVDDNRNNRMILKLLLEDYEEENENVSFEIEEAEDGLIAVEKCRKNSFDIVLMDIMMPNMDGIEATKIIREENQKMMIIAVSAVDDSERKKLILNNGAEDYISKPVNSDIFISRIANYITLIEARSHKRSNLQGVNLFTQEIFCWQTKFFITSEDALSEFWEYFLLGSEQKYDDLSDVVRTVFAIADIQVRLGTQSEIIIEDSEESKFFTLTMIDALPPKVLELTLKKNQIECAHKIADGKISFELKKIISVEETALQEQVVVAPVIAQEEETVASPVEFTHSEQNLQVFDYLDADDLDELEEFAAKLNSLMLIVGSGGITEEEVTEIYTYLEKLGSILATYSEVYPISKALNELSNDMATHVEEFVQNSEALGPMCKAFSNDFSNWIEMSFHTGAPSTDFMNDTIAVNCQTIGGMLKMDEAPADGGDDFDDIFDF